MKKIPFIVIILLYNVLCLAQKPFFPVSTDGKVWSFIDDNGKKVLDIKPLLTDCTIFSEGLAAAKDSLSGSYGYLDEKGAWAIRPQFTEAGNFVNGLAVVGTACDANCLTEAGGLMIFGYTKVIDKKGKVVLNDNAQEIEPALRFWFDGYNDGTLLRVTHGLSVGDIKTMMNRKGEFVGQRSGMCCLTVSDGWIAYNTYQGNYYTDVNGKIMLKIKNFDRVSPFTEGVAIATDTSERTFLIDKKGKQLLVLKNSEYNYAGAVGDGLFRVTFAEHDVYMNLKGKVVIDNAFVSASRFSNGLAHVEAADNKHYYIDKTAKKVITIPETNLQDIEYGEFTADGYAFIRSNTGSFATQPVIEGVVFKNGTTVWRRTVVE